MKVVGQPELTGFHLRQCFLCGWKFQTRQGLMHHRATAHGHETGSD